MMQTRVHRARPNEDSFISRLMYKRKFRRSNLFLIFYGKHHERLLLKPRAFNKIVRREYGNWTSLFINEKSMSTEQRATL